MARMSREFTLVLLGTSLLAGTALFVSEEESVFRKAEEQTARQVTGSHHHRGGFMIIPILRRGFSGGPMASASSATVARGGFGSFGARVGATS